MLLPAGRASLPKVARPVRVGHNCCTAADAAQLYCHLKKGDILLKMRKFIYLFVLKNFKTVSGVHFGQLSCPLKNLQGNCVQAVFQKIQAYPGQDLNPRIWDLEQSTLTTRLQQVANWPVNGLKTGFCGKQNWNKNSLGTIGLIWMSSFLSQFNLLNCLGFLVCNK